MPSFYTSIPVNVTQVNNERNVSVRLYSNNSSAITTYSVHATQNPYGVLKTNATSTPSDHHLNGLAIFFIVFSVILFVILTCALIYYIYRRKKGHKLPPPPPIPTPRVDPRFGAPPNPRKFLPPLRCRKSLCIEYLAQFNLPKGYFTPKYDKCFCKKCHDSSNPDIKCGNWCTEFHGWTRFSVRVSDVHKNEWKIFQKWKTSFYGTSPNRLLAILTARFVPLDGDTLADQTLFSSGHPDKTHCNTSPSLECASQPKFTRSSNFKATDGNTYSILVVLQCKQKPDSYITRENPNSHRNVEWATKSRSSVVPSGLLVRLKKI